MSTASLLQESNRRISIFGVEILDYDMAEALVEMERFLFDSSGDTRLVFFVNAHTLNFAWASADYLRTLQAADCVFGDGTGVRWAARWLYGIRLRDNVNGTDLVPRLFAENAGRGLRYFLLGTTEEALDRAVRHAHETFHGCELVGAHHGYVDIHDSRALIEQVNEARPHLLLVGMGNPKQEQWLMENKRYLRVPLCMGVGGLFTYWAGDLDRAPLWMRRAGIEWLHLMRRQKPRAARYLVGGPQFLLRLLSARAQGESLATRRMHGRG